MSFTRFHDDPCRIQKQLQEMTGPGRYALNVPGNGDKPCFIEDPYVRLQEWGANLRTNSINLESDLLGLTRNLNRDCMKPNNYKNHETNSREVSYPQCKPFTDQSRATHPAWEVRDLEQPHWSILQLDPQKNVCIPFKNNQSSRILEKDYFVAQAPCVSNAPVPELPTKQYDMNINSGFQSSCNLTNSCSKIN
jgi:hypothetical protein